jgi:hypothetical protein
MPQSGQDSGGCRDVGHTHTHKWRYTRTIIRVDDSRHFNRTGVVTSNQPAAPTRSVSTHDTGHHSLRDSSSLRVYTDHGSQALPKPSPSSSPSSRLNVNGQESQLVGQWQTKTEKHGVVRVSHHTPWVGRAARKARNTQPDLHLAVLVATEHHHNRHYRPPPETWSGVAG